MGNGGGGGGGGGGGELELPQDFLSVLPSDPYEQLDVARRITAMAVTARVANLESETGKLRLKLAEKEHVIHDLQERVGDAESSLQETTARLAHALDEQAGSTLTPPPPPPPPPGLLSCHSFSASVSFCFSDSLSLSRFSYVFCAIVVALVWHASRPPVQHQVNELVRFELMGALKTCF
jgi:hypothetical protein